MGRHSRTIARGAAVLAAWLFAPAVARGQEKAACIEAHEHGQEVRLANHWVEARRLFLSCAQPGCPPLVVQDCTRWEDELAQHIPSVVVSARRADGAEIDDVALFVDGARFGGRLPVVPIPLDPGEHVLRFEHSGWRGVERRVVVHDGEHDRQVAVTLEPPHSAKADISHEPESPARPTPAAVYLAAGVAAVATATSLAFLVVGKVSEHDLATSPCGRAGACSQSQVDPIRADYVVSGVAAGVAVVAVGIAAWELLSRGSRPARGLAWTGRVEF